MSKPEAGQCYPQFNDVTREFLLYDIDAEADYKGDADGVTLRLSHANFEGYRNAMRLLRKYLETNNPTPPANQPDPDEWVVQDRVPPRRNIDEFRYVRKDGLAYPWKSAYCDMQWPHGEWVCGERLEVRCRRRDLPPVEQPEQWPKYWTTVDHDGEVAFVKQVSEISFSIVLKDGTESTGYRWKVSDETNRKQLTESEAMALLKKPEPGHVPDASKKVNDEALELIVHLRDQMEALSKRVAECERLLNKPEPQPAKTRVRLWIPREWNSRSAIVSTRGDEKESNLWQEIHHDADGFYVEESK